MSAKPWASRFWPTSPSVAPFHFHFSLGILAGYSVGTLIGTYVLLLATALFVSVMGLWASMLVEGSGARSVGLLSIIPVGLAFGLAGTPFPGFGALSIFPALWSLYGVRRNGPLDRVQAVIFGQPVSFDWLTLILYASFGAWFVLMLRRNIKKDPEQTRLLSRWQAIGFAAFINFLFYAFLDSQMMLPRGPYNSWISPAQFSMVAVGLNALIFFVIGVAMLSPREKLRVWWRKHAAGEETYLSESGPPWPWLIPAAVLAYLMLAAEALSLYRLFPVAQWHLGAAALAFLVFLVFTARDILFLQWAILTRMKRPIVKGFLYLWLYYTAAGIVASVLSIAGPAGGRFVSEVLTPYGALKLGKARAPDLIWNLCRPGFADFCHQLSIARGLAPAASTRHCAGAGARLARDTVASPQLSLQRFAQKELDISLVSDAFFGGKFAGGVDVLCRKPDGHWPQLRPRQELFERQRSAFLDAAHHLSIQLTFVAIEPAGILRL